jgi:antitoxin component of MazEF toxin-antitoxin module
MRTILQSRGDKYVIEVDRRALTDWKVAPDDVLEIRIAGDTLTAAPVKMASNDDLDELLDEVVSEHGDTLKRLSE